MMTTNWITEREFMETFE